LFVRMWPLPPHAPHFSLRSIFAAFVFNRLPDFVNPYSPIEQCG
jgi:hypothetical protein